MKNLYLQIFRNAILYHLGKIRFYCYLARITPNCRNTMLKQARIHAREIRQDMAMLRREKYI